MIGDSKAEGGFFEAMVAVMVITIAVTALFGHLLLWQTVEPTQCGYLSSIQGLELKTTPNGLKLNGLEQEMESILGRDDVLAVGFEAGVVTEEGPQRLVRLLGDPGQGSPCSERTTFLLDAPGERRLPAYYTLTVWHVN
ncbi:MAG: hypothetical protein AB7E27_05425 [Candidatus Methanomethylophilaceae archaeon]|jgi:hypothetical protein